MPMPNNTQIPDDNEKRVKAEIVLLPTWGKQKSPASKEADTLHNVSIVGLPTWGRQEKIPSAQLSWRKMLAIVVTAYLLFRILQVTENYWITTAVGLVAMLIFKKDKIAAAVGEAMQASQHKDGKAIIGIVFGEIFVRVVAYAAAIAFLIVILTSVGCGQHTQLFTKKFCQQSDANWTNFWNESSRNGY